MLRNGEHYVDPTAYVAIRNVTRENPLVYICSPYRDNPRINVMRARNYSASVLPSIRIRSDRPRQGYENEF